MSLYRVGDTYYVYLVHEERRLRRSCATGDRAVAQRIHDELRAELWQRRPARGSFYAALAAWRAQAGDKADDYRIGKLKRAYPDRQLGAVTAASLEAAIPASSAGTWNRYVILITAALNHARRAGLIEKIPAIPRKRQTPSRVRWLTADEWHELDKALPDHLRPLARFAVWTGLRQHNVTHLEWSQVDLPRKVAWVHADQAKGRRAIGVPLSPKALAVLKGQRGKHERWVFPYDGHPIGKIKTAWKAALKRAKIGDFTWHDLRHTWASWHVQSGTPLEVLRELGGWQTMQLVLRYAHLAPAHLQQWAGNSAKAIAKRHRDRKAA